MHNDKRYIVLGIDLEYFKLLEILRISQVRTFESDVLGKDAARELKSKSRDYDLPILNIYELYISTYPHDFTAPRVINNKWHKLSVNDRKKTLM